MESANLYQHHQLQPQLVYSYLASSSSTGHEWNPSNIALDEDDFTKYMTEILPNSREFWPKNINPVPSGKNTMLQDIKFCDSCSSYEDPLANKLQLSQNIKGNASDCFPKLSDLNDSSYMKNEQQDVIDLNQNLCFGSFIDGHNKPKLMNDESYSNREAFARFSGLAMASSNYLFSCAQSMDHNNLCASTSPLASSQSVLVATDILNYRNGVEGTGDQSLQERNSWGYCHVQQSSHSPSHSSNKTSAFRNKVSRTQMLPGCTGPMPSHEVSKKPRTMLQSSSSTLKVRKEKLGDRIAALHRLASPFGKTDTASVLTEAIGYIQFLQDQIQTLSMSYIKSSRSKSCRTTQVDLTMKDKKDDQLTTTQDLRSRGLCLVPLAFTSYICSYNGSI